MREIKFRGLSENSDGSKEWAYGYYGFCYGEPVIYDTDGNGVFVDIETVSQYTGLKDKNGVEIYEGDIVNCVEECCGRISWNESEDGFFFEVLLEDGAFEEERIYDYVDELEVIGNIYENQELLNEEERA